MLNGSTRLHFMVSVNFQTYVRLRCNEIEKTRRKIQACERAGHVLTIRVP